MPKCRRPYWSISVGDAGTYFESARQLTRQRRSLSRQQPFTKQVDAQIVVPMAADNKLELVVTVEVDKANQSIKSVNANLSGIEAAATKSAPVASQSIDGMTAAMVKGATAGDLLAESIKKALAWAKSWTVGAVEYAAHSSKLLASARALGEAHGYSTTQVNQWIKAVKQVGYNTQEAAHTVNRLIVADMDLAKSTGLAKVAKDAAAIENMPAGEALEKLLLGIESGASRGLRTMGIFVDFNKEVQIQELRLGKTLSENEVKQVRYNAVIREAAKIQGAHAAASGEAEAQVKKFHREITELREAIGMRFQEQYKSLVGHLKDVATWLKDNVDLLAQFGKVAMWVSGVLAAYALATKIMALAKSLAALSLASANPYALLATGALAAGAIVYSNWKGTQEQMRDRFNEMERKALREDVLSGRTRIDDLRKKGMTGDQIRELVSGRRALSGDAVDLGGPKVTIKGGNEPDIDGLKRAAEIHKRQAEVERESRQAAIEAGAKGQLGFAKEIAEMNARVAKWATFTDDKGVSQRIELTRQAWRNVLDELANRWSAYKEKFLKDNREHLIEYVKGEEEAARKRMEFEAELVQRRLQYNEEIARRNLEHGERLLGVEEERAGIDRDARLRVVEATGAQTLKQKVWVEQQKAAIEVDYLERVHAIKMRLFDLETSRTVLDEQANMQRLGYRADEIRSRIAELSQQREQIRQANQEATDAAVDAARQNAANRTVAMVRDHNRQIFDSFKRQAEGVFDALLTKSQSIWAAIGNSLKTALLTAIKDVVSSRVAAMLMQILTGTNVSFKQGGVGGGGIFGKFGGILGAGAVPVFGGMGGGTFGSGPVGGNPMILSMTGGGGLGPLIGSGGTGGSAAAPGCGGPLSKAGLANFLPGLKSLFGIGGSVQLGSGMATTWQAATLGQKLGSIGHSTGFALAGGILALDGLRRGGITGLAETTAGGVMIGYRLGGPLGAAIGAGAGAVAGIVRLFVKGAQEKAREKIKAVYGVDISDKAILRQIVDTAKSAYGGNLDVAIQSQQIRELVELYAMSTGQKMSGVSNQMRPVSLVQSGALLYQSLGFSNGAALPSLGGLPTLDRIGGGTAVGSQTVINITVPGAKEFFEKETVRVVVENPRAVQSATMSATKSNAGRREMASLQMSPGLLTA